MRMLVVLPTYCEADNIHEVLDSVLSRPEMPDVLVVDDDSPDGTGDMVLDEALDYPLGRVRVLRRAAKSGLGAAYRDGFALALRGSYDIIVQMDADGSHPVSAFAPMLHAIEDGADLVLGSRYTRGGSVDREWPMRRRVLSRGGNLYAQALLGSHTADLTGGFKMWRASTLARLDLSTLNAQGYAFQVQSTIAAARGGAVVREIPITFTERVHGYSKMHSGIIFEAMRSVLVLSINTAPASPHWHRPAATAGAPEDMRLAGNQ